MSRHLRIVVDTQELVPKEQMTELFDLHEKVGWFFFLDAPETKINIPELPETKARRTERNRQASACERCSTSFGSKEVARMISSCFTDAG